MIVALIIALVWCFGCCVVANVVASSKLHAIAQLSQ